MSDSFKTPDPYVKVVFKQLKKNRIAMISLGFLILFALVGLYAPLFASSKPIVIHYHGRYYFPLFRYLFYPGFYSKPIDLFYNVLMFTLPLGLIGIFIFKNGKKIFLSTLVSIQIGLFFLFLSGIIKNPAAKQELAQERKKILETNNHFREDPLLASFSNYPSWNFELKYMPEYAKINTLLNYIQRKEQHQRLLPYLMQHGERMPTLWEVDRRNANEERKRLEHFLTTHQKAYDKALVDLPNLMAAYRPFSHDFLIARLSLENAQKALENSKNDKERALKTFQEAQLKYEETLKKASSTRIPLEQTRSVIQEFQDTSERLIFLEQKKSWEERESERMTIILPAFFRQFHWEDDAGGQQSINQYIPWWELTRVNRKDLMAGLLFGIRISLVIGVTAVALSLIIGVPLGMIAGYFTGKTDIVICRLIEIWEAMPTFFMLLLIVAITQSKSIFLVIVVLGIFGWTGLGRFMRGETLKQRNLPYVLACHSQGFRHPRIMFSHILPNAIPPILTLLPFSMMAAITSEAGISFLGLGEEGSTSWGVLMAEGRSVFPGESYLLWPPAILLTLLLICIAIVGDALRDAIDPKMRQ